jgi:hypothetical protein
MKVKNLNGTSDSAKCPCGSWINHWEKYAGTSRGICAEARCVNDATVGAHVQKKDGSDNSWYIVPLCGDHNKQFGKELDISDNKKLVPATDRYKCG